MKNKILNIFLYSFSVALSVTGGLLLIIEYYEFTTKYPIINWNQKSINKLEKMELCGKDENPCSNFYFAVLGDNRDGKEVFSTILQRIQADKDIIFCIHLGDMVSDNSPNLLINFYKSVSRYFHKPFFICPGNHDINQWSRESFEKLFGRRYYKFKFCNTLFIVMDTSFPEAVTRHELEWLEKTLRCDYLSHTFLFMHQPLEDPRENGTHCLPSRITKKIKTILSKNKNTKTDCIFASHIHGFFRGKLWSTIPYIITGGAGAPLEGDNPQHYFYHYLKIHVTKSTVRVHIVKIKLCDSKKFSKHFFVNSGNIKYKNSYVDKFLLHFKFSIIEKIEFSLYIVVFILSILTGMTFLYKYYGMNFKFRRK